MNDVSVYHLGSDISLFSVTKCVHSAVLEKPLA